MMTVHEVSKLTGVSVRTLHYYNEIGLLNPASTTDAGYRLYDDTCLMRLEQIMLFKELEFSLSDIKKMIDNPGFDKEKALDEQIELLTLKKEHFENLISYAKKMKGEYNMDFKIFDNKKIEVYKQEAKKRWQNTEAYREYETKTADYSKEKEQALIQNMMDIFKAFGEKKDKSPQDIEVQELVKKLQDFITKNYYTCTKEILSSLGKMYNMDSEMKDNIDLWGGQGTSEFAAKAIEEYCK